MAYGTDLPKCHSRGWDLPTSAALLARSASVPSARRTYPLSLGQVFKISISQLAPHYRLKHGFVSPEAMYEDSNFPGGGHGCFLVPFALG
jgi:hypothetical protein